MHFVYVLALCIHACTNAKLLQITGSSIQKKPSDFRTDAQLQNVTQHLICINHICMHDCHSLTYISACLVHTLVCQLTQVHNNDVWGDEDTCGLRGGEMHCQH